MTPMSLRTEETEEQYQYAKTNGGLKKLYEEEPVYEFTHWYIVANRFPYDAVFDKHDMLLPKSGAKTRFDLTPVEKHELRLIQEFYIEPIYDVIMDNTMRKRSVKTVYHIHLCRYLQERPKQQIPPEEELYENN